MEFPTLENEKNKKKLFVIAFITSILSLSTLTLIDVGILYINAQSDSTNNLGSISKTVLTQSSFYVTPVQMTRGPPAPINIDITVVGPTIIRADNVQLCANFGGIQECNIINAESEDTSSTSTTVDFTQQSPTITSTAIDTSPTDTTATSPTTSDTTDTIATDEEQTIEVESGTEEGGTEEGGTEEGGTEEGGTEEGGTEEGGTEEGGTEEAIGEQ